MKLKRVKNRPLNGNWVEMWEFNGNPFSSIYRRRAENLRMVTEELLDDKWISVGCIYRSNTQHDVRYFIVKK